METLVCLKRQAIPSFNQPTHFRAVKMQLRNHNDKVQHTLSNTLLQACSGTTALCTAESINSRFFD